MRRVLCLLLVWILAFSVSFADEGKKSAKEYSEITEVEFNKRFDKLTDKEAESITKLGLDIKKIKKDEKIYKVIKKSIYVEIKEDGSERILTDREADVKKIEKYKKAKNKKIELSEENGNNSKLFTANNLLDSIEVASVGDYVDQDSYTYRNLNLFLIVYELDVSGKVGYKAYASAGYDEGPSIVESSANEPSTGEDCVAFAWGGDYDYDNESVTRFYKDESGDIFENIGYLANIHNPNQGRGWSFNEFIPLYNESYYLWDFEGEIELTKSSLEGETTKLVWSYCHTYSDESYSFSVGYNTAYITAQPATSRWVTDIAVTINK